MDCMDRDLPQLARLAKVKSRPAPVTDAIGPELIQFFKQSVEKRQGNCQAINAAFETAQALFPAATRFLMIDDDEIASPDWLELMVRTAEATGADVVGGPVLPVFDDDSQPWLARHPAFCPAYDYTGAVPLICLPLGVRQEFFDDAERFFQGEYSVGLRFIRSTDEMIEDLWPEKPIIYLTNYESIREGKIDTSKFGFVSLDEATCLRGFGGSKTFREFMARLAGDARGDLVANEIRYRFVATATPDPNDHIELLAYAAFLGIMDVGQAKTRFFKRSSEKADELVIHPHKEKEFWLWVASRATARPLPAQRMTAIGALSSPPTAEAAAQRIAMASAFPAERSSTMVAWSRCKGTSHQKAP